MVAPAALASAQESAPMTKPSAAVCLEVAVCTVSNPAGFDALQAQAHRDLASLPGYAHSVALRGHADAASRCDLVVWETLAAAKAASETIQRDARFAPFMAAIERVRHFAHYEAHGAGAATPLGALAQASRVVEVAAYTTASEAPMHALQAEVHAALEGIEGASPWVRGAQTEQPAALLDVIGWSGAASHEAAPGLIQARHPELAAFFGGVGELAVFELFEALAVVA